MTSGAAGGGSGLAFVDCGMSADVGSLPEGRRRGDRRERQAHQDSRRHAHCAVPEALALMGLKLEGPQPRPDLDMATTVSLRMKLMDEQGIDVEALSINPNWYHPDRDLAAKVIQIQNEKLAEACAANPDRFVAFATVALQFPDLAAEQLEERSKAWAAAASASAATSPARRSPTRSSTRSGPRPRSSACSCSSIRRATAAPAQLSQRFKGNGYLGNVIGNPLETTIALSHLIFEGTLDRFPAIKICAAHGGGFLPVLRGPLRPRLQRRRSRPGGTRGRSRRSRRST